MHATQNALPWGEEHDLLSEKRCSYCKKWKKLECFDIDKTKDGHDHRCKSCKSDERERREAAKAERIKAILKS